MQRPSQLRAELLEDLSLSTDHLADQEMGAHYLWDCLTLVMYLKCARCWDCHTGIFCTAALDRKCCGTLTIPYLVCQVRKIFSTTMRASRPTTDKKLPAANLHKCGCIWRHFIAQEKCFEGRRDSLALVFVFFYFKINLNVWG